MTMVLPLPPYLRGKNGSLVGVTPQTVTVTSGVATLTPGTAVNLKTLGVFDTFEFSGTYNGVDIHPTDGGVANYCGTFDDFEIKLGEIDRNGAPSVLRTLWGSYNFSRIEIDVSDDTGVLNAVFAAMLTRAGGNITYGLVEEKNGTIITLKPCGVLPYYGTGTPPF